MRTLNDELHRLHALSGHRSSYQIATWLKTRAEDGLADGWTKPSHTYVHRTLTRPELPNRAIMLNVVEALIGLGRIRNGRGVLDNVDDLWAAAYEYSIRRRRTEQDATTPEKPAQSKAEWPIQPMPGEPPLTLFHGKEDARAAPWQ